MSLDLKTYMQYRKDCAARGEVPLSFKEVSEQVVCYDSKGQMVLMPKDYANDTNLIWAWVTIVVLGGATLWMLGIL